jgi:DNA-3-methyladenine glycosylase
MLLTRAFYRRDPVAVARALLGQRLVRVLDGRRLAGIIVETEAYLGPKDQAAHSRNGHRSPRNDAMYADGGVAYVYFTYGMHHCFNVVAGSVDNPVAVLVRALQPTEGLDVMRRHRRVSRDTALCSGPAKLCQALAIDRAFNGTDLVTGDALFIERVRRTIAPRIIRTPRIGVAYAGDWAGKPLRFHLPDNPHVSRP